MTNLFDPPPIFTLPFSKGADLYFGFIYKPLLVDDDGLPILDAGGKKQYVITDYPVGSSVQLVIENTDGNVTVDASIVGSLATVWADKAIADTIDKAKLWRATITYANDLDLVMCNGTTTRSDGRPLRS